MKFLPAVFTVAAVLFMYACTDDDVSPVAPSTSVDDTPVASRLVLQDQLRQLGSERVFWIRVFIIDSLAALPDKDVTFNRLMKNQGDLGNALRPYYGDAMGVQLTSLLEEYVLQLSDLIATMQAGNAAQVQNLIDQWRQQANLIADFLATSNSSLNREQLRADFRLQSDATLAQINARIAKDWTGDILAYDTAQDRALSISDTVTAATATQYPAKVLAPVESQGEQDFHVKQRKLWQEHVSWECFLIISTVSGLADLQATTDRLLRNQRDLGDSLKPAIGEAAGNQLTQLLVDHVAGAASTLANGDTSAAGTVWIANADQIAALLSASIPSLDAAKVKASLDQHLELTAAEAAHRMAGEYQAEINAFDAALTEALDLADMITSGAATQSGAQSVPPT